MGFVGGTPITESSANADDLIMAHLAAIDASKAEITAQRCMAQEQLLVHTARQV